MFGGVHVMVIGAAPSVVEPFAALATTLVGACTLLTLALALPLPCELK